VVERGEEVVLRVAGENGWKVKRCEDGELVVRLVGKEAGKWPSGHAHAGVWLLEKGGGSRWYLYSPCTQPSGRARVAREMFPGLEDHSGDSELLLMGPMEDVVGLIACGPSWARARRKKVFSEAQKAEMAERLVEYHFKPGK
jgi:hypothetical protein